MWEEKHQTQPNPLSPSPHTNSPPVLNGHPLQPARREVSRTCLANRQALLKGDNLIAFSPLNALLKYHQQGSTPRPSPVTKQSETRKDREKQWIGERDKKGGGLRKDERKKECTKRRKRKENKDDGMRGRHRDVREGRRTGVRERRTDRTVKREREDRNRLREERERTKRTLWPFQY
ncbi:hypothetical protein C0Q70_12827 [Pomacea canaliculata]|uniref:Uncharacterized protein n=1 Tax=Pomacea canaliculata TaxID=400727 RepID=A0A2T7P2M6_POMCA|nr:hypothetical protein C0Q70_12827 [Pomacea canaliculata]